MASDPNISLLLDLYGKVLTDKQKECLDLYYNQDFSLSEISEYYNITRQGAQDFIKRGKSCLLDLENKIKFLDKTKKQQRDILKIINLSEFLIKYNKKYNKNSSCCKIISNFSVFIYKIAKKIYDN